MGCLKLHIEPLNLRVIHRKKPQKPSKTTGSDSPFGLKHKGYNNIINGTSHPYGYGGKEENDELDLGWLDFGARNYNPELGRWMNIDPLAEVYYGFTPYNFTTNNPIVFVDPNGMASVYNWGTGRYEDEDGNEVSWSNVQAEYGIGGKSSSSSAKPDDAKVTIKNGKATISSTIYIYGSGATQNIANLMQSDIMSAWGKNQNGNDWTYTDPSSGKVYTVAFDIQVKLYDSKNAAKKPSLFSGKNNPFSTDNFIEIDKNNARSYVRGGDEGQWRGNGRNGLALGQDDPAPHEFGHMIGLTDRYSRSGANTGWTGNIMAEPAMQGIVQQKNIDAVLSHIISRYNSSFTKWANDNFGTNKQYNTKIDESNPKW